MTMVPYSVFYFPSTKTDVNCPVRVCTVSYWAPYWHLGILLFKVTQYRRFLVNDQPDALIIFYVFISIYNSLHVLSTSCSSSGETNCINTASGNCHSVLVAEMCAGWKKTDLVGVFFQPAHISASNIEWLLPEAVLIQFVSPDDEHDVLETCREL